MSSSSLSSLSWSSSMLPDVVWQQIILYLPPADICSFLSSHRSAHDLGMNFSFWSLLLRTRYGIHSMNETEEGHEQETTLKTCIPKQLFLQYSYADVLPTVKWYPVQRTRSSPQRQEGHSACLLKDPTNNTNNPRHLLVTGGFVHDSTIYLKRLSPSNISSSLSEPASTDSASAAAASVSRADKTNNYTNCGKGGDWITIQPSTAAEYCYGASLTALDAHRAIRFGGFRQGGYSREWSQLSLLTLSDDFQSAQWTVIEQSSNVPTENDYDGRRRHVAAIEDANVNWNPQFNARAYHSATLIENRYLLILGGMKSHGSVLNPIILDTSCWKWILPIIASDDGEEPSPRHGQSVILDEKRNRLVVFGGGSGSTLNESSDNSEVWELKMGHEKWIGGKGHKENIAHSFPWKWRLLHTNQHSRMDGDQLDQNEDSESPGDAPSDNVTSTNKNPNILSHVERLTLGRCHVAHRVSPDTVLLAFGSRWPSTNGVLAYDLATNSFRRPKVIGNFLPRPRFTCVSVYLEQEGYVFVHGGFASETSSMIDEGVLLDVAPALSKHDMSKSGHYLHRGVPFDINGTARSSRPVDDSYLNDSCDRFRWAGQAIMRIFPDDMDDYDDDDDFAIQGSYRVRTSVLMRMFAANHGYFQPTAATFQAAQSSDDNEVVGGGDDDDDDDDDETYMDEDDNEDDN